MDASWADALISGLSGVGGAVVGAGATLLVLRRSEKERWRSEHHAALTGYFAAVNQVGMFLAGWAELQPKRENVFTRARLGLQIAGREEWLLNRAWGAYEGYWLSSARVRAVATADELVIVNAMDTALGAWQVGKAMPDEWPSAVQQLRDLIETLPAPHLGSKRAFRAPSAAIETAGTAQTPGSASSDPRAARST